LYHYLGESFSDIYVLARYKDEIIGCFGLTSSEEYMEINRICWNPNYENRNDIVIALIISYCVNNNISEIIGLSDNRLFTGNIFCNMGFHLIEELPPNYQYTNGHVRISKDQYDKMTNAKNYHRIWNSGYKKYILNLKK
jgi:N-acetylglutamate synthase-like GNAT family acetyltransferase